MRGLFTRIFIFTLIFCMAAGPAAAFDLKIGHLNFNPSSANATGPNQCDHSGFGAMLTIPLGSSGPGKTTATLNGQDISQFTQQDAKDSLIVIMLFGVAIGAAVLSASAVAN